MEIHGPANEENEFQENENFERFMRCLGKSWILPSSPTNPHYCEIICFFLTFFLSQCCILKNFIRSVKRTIRSLFFQYETILLLGKLF